MRQVEDRKKAIMDAERDRREYILRKNQEREARLDTKRKNERSSIAFAFGSSTPRLLDPVEVNLVSPSGSYWGNRRSTSITNVSYGSGGGVGGATQLSRRSSERELSDGNKKRATSAGGLDRPDGEIQNACTICPFIIFICNITSLDLFEFHKYTHIYRHMQRIHPSNIEVSSHFHTQFRTILSFYHSMNNKKLAHTNLHTRSIKHSSNQTIYTNTHTRSNKILITL